MRKFVFSVAFVLLSLAVLTQAQPIIVDNGDSTGFSVLSGNWFTSTAAPGYYGANYLACATTATGAGCGEVEWRPDLPESGLYEVFVNYVAGANRADNAPFTVYHRDGSTTIHIDQQATGSQLVSLGTFTFDAGAAGSVRLSNEANLSYVIADVVQFQNTKMQIIPPDHPQLGIEGTLFARLEAGGLWLRRFTEEILRTSTGTYSTDRAKTASGIEIRVRTNSSWVGATFEQISGFWISGEMAIYQDGMPDASGNPLYVMASSSNPGQPVTYRILCPPYESLSFTGLQLEPGATLYPLPDDCRPRYLAVGDSITHGSGMPRGDQTYPWLLAEAKGWQLFNLGVSGSRVTPTFGSLFDNEPLDVVTILWGHNDFSAVNDLPLYITQYEAFLTNLRQYHPITPIYCITLTASTVPEVGSNGYTRQQYRQAVRDIVLARQAAGDDHIQVIEGLDLTTTDDLRDTVHFSESGNVNVAANLGAILPRLHGSGAFFDFDYDCDVDSDDFAAFVGCTSGPQTPFITDCDRDADNDGDVDQGDFAMFQRCFSGEGNAADPICAD